MRDSLRHFIAEFVGTFALVFVGGAAIMSVTMQGGQTGPGAGGLLTVALAHGLILSLLVTATMRVSGHLNPAVTLGFLVTRRIEPMMAGVYVAAQLLGAMLAAYALKGLLPTELYQAARGGGQFASLDITSTQAYV